MDRERKWRINFHALDKNKCGEFLRNNVFLSQLCIVTKMGYFVQQVQFLCNVNPEVRLCCLSQLNYFLSIFSGVIDQEDIIGLFKEIGVVISKRNAKKIIQMYEQLLINLINTMQQATCSRVTIAQTLNADHSAFTL